MRTRFLATAGVLALASSAALAFVVVPNQAVWPDDVDTTRTYEGTLETMLDAQALAAADLGNLFITDVPVTIARTTTTTAVADGNALIADGSVVTAPDGTVLLTSDSTVAIDRKTFQAVDAVGDVTVPAREGYAMGFPLGVPQADLTMWSDELGRTVEVTYEGEAQRAGRDVYVFRSVIDNGLIVDETTLARFPAELPKFAITMLLPSLDLPEAVAAQVDQLLPTLPNTVPLTYLYSGDATFFVDPATGMLIDVERTESRAVAVTTDAVPFPIPVTDVFRWTYTATPETVAAASADADDIAGQLTLFGTVIPGLLALAGVALLGTAFAGRRRGQDEVIDLTGDGPTIVLDDADTTARPDAHV